MENASKPSSAAVTIEDYDAAMRRLFRLEVELDEAQTGVDAAKRECDRIRRELFGTPLGKAEPSCPSGEGESLKLPEGSSHMPRILAFLLSQPGHMAKANAIVAALDPSKESSIRSALVRMTKPKDGRLTSPKRGYFKLV